MRVGWVKESVRAQPRRRWAAGVAIGALLLGGAIASTLIFTGAGQAEQTMMSAEAADELFATAAPLAEPPSSPLPTPNLELNRPFRFVGSGDFDGDGTSAIVAADDGFIRLYQQGPNGDFALGPRVFVDPERQTPTEGASTEPQQTVSPLAGTVADLTGDGALDVALATRVEAPSGSSTERRLYVFQGRGDGTFEVGEPINLPAGGDGAQDFARPLTLVARDLNGDGASDLLLIERLVDAEPPIRWLKNDGDGGLAPAEPVELAIEAEPPILRVFDAPFGASAQADLALLFADRVTTLTLTDGPTLQADVTLRFPEAGVQDADAADVDADGRVDLITVGADDGIAIHRRGANGFETIGQFTIGAELSRLETGDANGDGHVDLFVLDELERTLTTVLGDGAGAFAVSRAIPHHLRFRPSRLALADLTGNGRTDVALGTQIGVQLLTHQKEPTGLSRVEMAAERVHAVADLDGDGDPDLVTETLDGLGALWNNGRGVFARRPLLETDATPLRAAGGDLDGDGRDEVALLMSVSDGRRIVVLEAADPFGEAAVIAARSAPNSGLPNVEIGDLDNDGRPAVVTTAQRALLAWRLDEQGNLSRSRFAANEDLNAITLGDFDDDGRDEVLAAVIRELAEFRILERQSGDWRMSDSLLSLVAVPLALASGDVNDDGITDAVVISADLKPRRQQDQNGGADDGADSDEAKLEQLRFEIPNAFLSAFRGGADAISAENRQVPEWTTNAFPWPINGLALADSVRPGDGAVAVGTRENAPIRVFSQGRDHLIEQPVVPCAGGPLFRADLNGDGRLDLIGSTVTTIPHACVAWGGESR